MKSDSPPKTSSRWIRYSLLAVAALAASLWFFGRASLNSPSDLDLYFTCDVHGRLVPCGCFSGQMGGLTRIATLIAADPWKLTLKVDVGGALDGVADYQVIQYRYLLRAFHEIGYEAANLGHPEARLSATQLRDLKASSPVPLLSANLLDRASGEPLFDAYRIVQRGPYRIALVGVMDEHISPENLGEGLAVEPMQAALSRLLPMLRKAADFIVLLAFTDETRLRQLARDDYEIQVILGGNVSQPAQRLEHLNRSYILYTTNQSRALGSLVLSLLGPGKLRDKSGEIVLVADSIAEDPAIRKLDDEYRAEIRQTKLQIDDPAHSQGDVVPGVKAAAQYVGSEACIQCHVSAVKAWQDSRHAQAYQALVQAGADADPNCLACHTVGFGAPSGYRRAAPTRFTDVGCESCHGPGSAHVAQHAPGAEVTSHLRPLGVADCQKCHHGEFSRPFDWPAFWPQIQHGLDKGK